MEINSISAFQPPKPSKPAEPTPPPGGNIENRQPPPEPSKPSSPQKSSDFSIQPTSNGKAVNSDRLIDVYA